MHVVLIVFGIALKLLLFVVDGLGARCALVVVELVALGLELLGKGVDFVIQGLELRLLGLVLPLQIGKAALALVGLRDGDLKRDDGDLGRAGGSSSGCGAGCIGRQGRTAFERRRSGQGLRPA